MKDKKLFCTYCGKETLYKGVRFCTFRGEKIYNQETGSPFREHYWECPEKEKFWSDPRHTRYTELISLEPIQPIDYHPEILGKSSSNP